MFAVVYVSIEEEVAAKRPSRAKAFEACMQIGSLGGGPAKKERFGHGKVSHRCGDGKVHRLFAM